MQLKSFSVTLLFFIRATTTFALPTTEVTGSNGLDPREPVLDLSEIDIRDVTLTDRDADLTERGTVHCANQGQIKRVKPLYQGKCMPAQSKGWRSAHNCPGKSYLCVQSDKATCYVSQVSRETKREKKTAWLNPKR